MKASGVEGGSSVPAPAAGQGSLPPYVPALGLVSNPFPVTPDETHYFFTPATEAVFEEVRHFIEMRKGFLLLTGDIGLGKTTMLRRLLASFDKARYNTALILTSFLDQSELLEAIAADFGVSLPKSARRMDYLTALNAFLLAESERGKINVLCIDDAQALNVGALDVVRQLSNLETAKSKLIQVVLCGQTELLDTLNQYSLRQVKSRIALLRQLHPLGIDDTYSYIQHRLTHAGAGNAIRFTREGLEVLHGFTQGFPRRIHHLMDRCLYALVATGQTQIDDVLVRSAWDDLGWQTLQAPQTPGPTPPTTPVTHGAQRDALWPRWARLAADMLRRAPGAGSVAAVLVLGGLGLWAWKAQVEPAATATTAPLPTQAQPPSPGLIAEPPEWGAVRQAFPGLNALVWPSASSVPELMDKLGRSVQPHAWQSVVAQGNWVDPCRERPVLLLKDAQGEIWRLSFVEAALPTQPVAFRTQGEHLRKLQHYFADKGWMSAQKIDGTMGRRTALALVRFQRSQGLEATGQFNLATAYRLSCHMALGGAPVAGVRS